MLAARAHAAEGRRFVVDLDLEKFFDRVNHNVLVGGVPGCGQTGSAADPPLPAGWIDDGRDYDGTERRHTARWPYGSLNAKDNFAVEERSRNYRRRRAPFHPEG